MKWAHNKMSPEATQQQLSTLVCALPLKDKAHTSMLGCCKVYLEHAISAMDGHRNCRLEVDLALTAKASSSSSVQTRTNQRSQHEQLSEDQRKELTHVKALRFGFCTFYAASRVHGQQSGDLAFERVINECQLRRDLGW